MHNQRNARQLKKLDLRKETLRRLSSLSDAQLRQAIGGKRATVSPSIIPTSDDTGC